MDFILQYMYYKFTDNRYRYNVRYKSDLGKVSIIHLLPAERNGIFEHGPNYSFFTGRCGKRALVAEVAGHITLRGDEHVQGHITQGSVGA